MYASFAFSRFNSNGSMPRQDEKYSLSKRPHEERYVQHKWWSNARKMEYIQKNCQKFRLHSAINSKEPTLFAFIVRKMNVNLSEITGINDIKSNRYSEHYFCADNEQFLEGWKKCIIEQIAHSNNGDTRKNSTESQFLRNKLAKTRKRTYIMAVILSGLSPKAIQRFYK